MRDFLGELLGTFILVFFGCGAVAVSVLFSAFSGLFQVAVIWGIGVTLAIYASRTISYAHLNPAVSIAFALAKRLPLKKLPIYLIAQFSGAFLAAFLLYVIFGDSIAKFELVNNILRGSVDSVRSAMIFGEYFPNPALNSATISVSALNAFLAEGFGTFLLVFFIFVLTEGCNAGRPDSRLVPVFIGMVVSGIVCLIAALTQAGINPARDIPCGNRPGAQHGRKHVRIFHADPPLVVEHPVAGLDLAGQGFVICDIVMDKSRHLSGSLQAPVILEGELLKLRGYLY